MDAVVSPASAIEYGRMGGLAVMNLDGVQTRYDDPDAVLKQIAETPQSDVTALLQKLYAAPVRDNLVAERVAAIKKGGVVCAVSTTPANTKRLAPIAKEAGMDILVVQSTVTTATHSSKSARGLVLPELKQHMKLPVIVAFPPLILSWMTCSICPKSVVTSKLNDVASLAISASARLIFNSASYF